MSLKFTITKNQLNKLGLYNLNVEAVFKNDSKFCEDYSEFKIWENEGSSDEYTDFTEHNVNIDNILKTIKNILDEGKWCDFEDETNEILMSYANRKSNFIKYTPTDKEITDAVFLYKKILTDAEHQEKSALLCRELLKSTSENTEVQIKLLGALFEANSKFPDGASKDDLMNISEKWDVLDYMTEELLCCQF
ncbi:Uncharacterised protein [uncultured archaeon]|nr:Uncharacterised protein [uncultured archaeon]